MAVDVFAGWGFEVLAAVDVGAHGEGFGGVGGLFDVGEVTRFEWEFNAGVGGMDEVPKFQADGSVVWRAGIESFGSTYRQGRPAGGVEGEQLFGQLELDGKGDVLVSGRDFQVGRAHGRICPDKEPVVDAKRDQFIRTHNGGEHPCFARPVLAVDELRIGQKKELPGRKL